MDADWEGLLGAVLDRWHGSASVAPPPPGVPAELVNRLADRPEPVRGPLLALLRERLGGFPFDAVHPSWLVPHVPADPLLKRWALGAVPPTVRRRLLALLPPAPPPAVAWWDTTGAPDWFAPWWTGELRRALRYPVPLPGWRDPAKPVTWLATLDEEELDRLLRRVGLRPLAAAIHRLDRNEVVRIAYALPPTDQALLVERVRAAADPVAGWPSALGDLLHRGVATADLPPQLALIELAAAASVHGFAGDLRRLALRLSRDAGEALLAMAEDPRWRPLAPRDAGEWHASLAADAAALEAERALVVPDLREETMS